MPNRSAYYISEMFAEMMTKGMRYQDIPKAITIIITGYVQFPQSNSYRHHFLWYEKDQHFLLTDRMEIIYLDLERVKQQFRSGTLPICNDASLKWLLFLLAKDHPTIANEVEKMAIENPSLQEVFKALDRITSDPGARADYLEWKKRQFDEADALLGAREEGMKEGIKQGFEQRAVETARIALKKGYDLQTVSELSGLSPEHVQQIKAKLSATNYQEKPPS
ncbi:putative transposase/invertase (TIGR01784 family) [Heliophilum fasciatum]|nr:putative transposase/invertase (TIGR01784 family) [Heliophilum fasciatum]